MKSVNNRRPSSPHSPLSAPRSPRASPRDFPLSILLADPPSSPRDTPLFFLLADPPSSPQTYSPRVAHPGTPPFVPPRAPPQTHQNLPSAHHIPRAAPRRSDGSRSLLPLLYVHLSWKISAVQRLSFTVIKRLTLLVFMHAQSTDHHTAQST
jgi:hypothetical protein